MKIIACDQSLTGTALVGLDNGKEFLRETVVTPVGAEGFERVSLIIKRINEILTLHTPDVFVIEDYSGSANPGTMIKLCELGGCIKMMLHQNGYVFGADAVRKGKGKVVLIQSAKGMKKFMLGNGNAQKDTRYLLTVMERLKVSFDDDNQADAYMHAWQAGVVVGVLRGSVMISDLPKHQQEALISEKAAKKKGLSKAKAMKLGDKEKAELISF